MDNFSSYLKELKKLKSQGSEKIKTFPAWKQGLGVLGFAILALSLPVSMVLVRNQQDIRQRASEQVLFKLAFQPTRIQTKITEPPTQMSVLAYDEVGNPISNGVTYEWGISSSNSIGTLEAVSGSIATFIPKNDGVGDIFVTAKTPSQSITSSIQVIVGDPPIINPTIAPTTIVNPTNICKIGVSSFSVDTPCEENKYKYMTFSCQDGFGQREGSTSSCKSSEAWSSYAQEYCKNRSSCNQISPAPTSYPTQIPNPSKIPSSSPSLIPTSTAACVAPTITSYSDTNKTGGGTVTFKWKTVSGATLYTIQRRAGNNWITISTTTSTSFRGSDASSDPNWRVFVSKGSCKPIPGPAKILDP